MDGIGLPDPLPEVRALRAVKLGDASAPWPLPEMKGSPGTGLGLFDVHVEHLCQHSDFLAPMSSYQNLVMGIEGSMSLYPLGTRITAPFLQSDPGYRT